MLDFKTEIKVKRFERHFEHWGLAVFQIRVRNGKLSFLFLNQNICCG